jgi:hypothetical protein
LYETVSARVMRLSKGMPIAPLAPTNSMLNYWS